MIRSQLLPILLGLAAGVLCAVATHRIAPRSETEAARAGQSAEAAIRQPSLRRELLSRLEEYVSHRSRHRMLLLEEVVSAYMRTDAEECLALLYSRKAQSLVADHTLGSANTHINLDDFAGVLRTAKEVDGRTGDALIKKAFRKLTESDPQKAFSYLPALPAYLRERLATELAKSWATRDGPAAVEAFYKTKNVEFWQSKLMEGVFPAWAKVDPEAAYQRMINLGEPGKERDERIGSFFNNIAQADIHTAIRLAMAHGDLPPAAMQEFSFAFSALSRDDPQAALEAAASLPASNMRLMALQGIAGQGWAKSPQAALEAADQLPASRTTMYMIKNVTSYLALADKEPYAAVDQETDPYRRKAAISGVCDGKVWNKGVDGMTEIVQKGLSTGDQGWFQAAGELALLPKLSLNPGSEKAAPDWKSLPPDVAEALLNYAKQNWTPEKAAALQGKLK